MKYSTLVLFLFLLLPAIASAQAVYTFMAVDGLQSPHEKLLHHAVLSVDEQALFSTHGDQFKVRTAARVQDLLAALASAGAGEVRLVHDLLKGVPPYPVKQQTGNDDEDEAAYQAAKAAWIAAYPEAYKSLTGQPSNPE